VTRLLGFVLASVLLVSACSLGKVPENSDNEPVPEAALREAGAVLGNDPAAAKEVFAGLLEQYPASFGAARGFQDARRALEEATAFRESYLRSAEGQPGDALAQYLYGRAVIDDPERAQAAFEKARELAPLNPWPTIGLAFVHRTRGDLFQTVQTYRQALVDAPRSAMLHTFLGLLYVELKLHVDARRELNLAVQLDPASARARAGLGRTQLALHNKDSALASLLEARRLNAGLPEVYYDLARLYLELRCPVEAESMYSEGLSAGMAQDTDLRSAIRAAGYVAEGAGTASPCATQGTSNQKS